MKHRVTNAVAIMLCLGAVVHISGAATTVYQYDALGRLTTVSQGTTQTTYGFDPAGNRSGNSGRSSSSVTPTPISFAQSGSILEHKGNVVLTANVGNSSTSGVVSFYDGSTLIGTAVLSNGVATLTVTSLSAGTHTITVAYAGSGSTPASSIATQVKIVNMDWLPAVLQLLLQ
jgi:YD repeat-containing protein